MGGGRGGMSLPYLLGWRVRRTLDSKKRMGHTEWNNSSVMMYQDKKDG